MGSELHGTTLSTSQAGYWQARGKGKRLRASRCKMVVSNVTIHTRRISHV